MICIKTVKKYCSEDISKIENYEQAVNDKTQTWHCHHRAEILPCGRYKQADLKRFGLYWNRPADELVFMLDAEHQKMHHLGQRVLQGRRWYTNGNESVLAYESPGEGWTEGRIRHRKIRKVLSPSQRRKKLSLSKSKVNSVQNVGRHWWNNGHDNKFCYESPGDGWTEGRICRRRSQKL